MRKSILALAIGGLLAGAAYLPVPASAQTTTVIREGRPANVLVVKPNRYKYKQKVVVVKPAKKKIFVQRNQPRRVVVVHRDGSRTIRYVRPRGQVTTTTVIRRD
jgi:hypothetical protein